jgi:hypothetical protein
MTVRLADISLDGRTSTHPDLQGRDIFCELHVAGLDLTFYEKDVFFLKKTLHPILVVPMKPITECALQPDGWILLRYDDAHYDMEVSLWFLAMGILGPYLQKDNAASLPKRIMKKRIWAERNLNQQLEIQQG